MVTWLEILVLLAAVWALAIWRTPLWVWMGFVGLYLLHWSSAHDPWLVFAGLIWILYLAIAVVLLIPDLRRRWVSTPLLEQFVRIMPTMSDTEREALEAGTVGW